MFNWWRRRRLKQAVDPDEIFLDARNLPAFDQQQFEDQLERPITKMAVWWVAFIFLAVSLGFIWRIGIIQINQGEVLAARSESNRLRHTVIFPNRGPILDRQGQLLAWSDNGRQYLDQPGLAHVLGFIGLPNESELATGQYHPQEWLGKAGVERAFNSFLAGQTGRKIEEVDAWGNIQSDYLLQAPQSGEPLQLSIDGQIQTVMYQAISTVADNQSFQAGAGVIIDVKTGEILALVSYPEFKPQVLVQNQNQEKIESYLTDDRLLFLNRVISGVYAPGSVVKPMVAAGVLAEQIIDPDTTILSTGTMVVPNPYHPDQPSVFRDWRAHGSVDLRRALAVSSNIYFYQVGGGFGRQPGLGITRLERYFRHFGFGQPTGIDLGQESTGIVPNPAWKADRFNGDIWRLGDTYHTAIGQFGMQVTPIQVAVAMSQIATSGQPVTPTVRLLAANQTSKRSSPNWSVTEADWQIIRDGLRQAVTSGTAQVLNIPDTEIAAKTGTAQIGTARRYVNSWMTGFWPANEPKWAFAVVMERGPQNNQVGAGVVMRQILDWMQDNTPEYLQPTEADF